MELNQYKRCQISKDKDDQVAIVRHPGVHSSPGFHSKSIMVGVPPGSSALRVDLGYWRDSGQF